MNAIDLTIAASQSPALTDAARQRIANTISNAKSKRTRAIYRAGSPSAQDVGSMRGSKKNLRQGIRLLDRLLLHTYGLLEERFMPQMRLTRTDSAHRLWRTRITPATSPILNVIDEVAALFVE